MRRIKNYLALSLLIAISFSCEKETISEDLEMKFQKDEIQYPTNEEDILFVKNSDNLIIGYYYIKSPNNIISLNSKEGTKLNTLNKTMDDNEVVHLVGDEDNFGFGLGNAIPCNFFNLSNPEIDLGIFDRVESGDDIESWVHNFTNDPNFCSGGTAEKVTIEIRENFTDPDKNSTITVDGMVLQLNTSTATACDNGPQIREFVFTGTDAAFANDGIIEITFKENGDNIALDWSKVTIKFLCPDDDNDGCLDEDDPIIASNMEETVILHGCDTSVENRVTSACGVMMSDLIDELEVGTYRNHGGFVKEVAQLTEAWLMEGLITQEEKDAIVACAGQSN